MGWKLGVLSGLTLPAALVAGGLWWFADAPEPEPPEPPLAAMPVPPFPPRITDDPSYELCLGLLPEDPQAAISFVLQWTSSQPTGGRAAARHCQALALIAAGQAAEGASMLETLADDRAISDRARALLLDQAADAWFLMRSYEEAYRATTRALMLAPDDAEVLLRHAQAASQVGRENDAIADLTRVLADAPDRLDALLARAMAWRRLDQLERAAGDSERAAGVAPTDPEVLLERGIQRQRRGDLAGAREDWRQVVTLEPDSEAADLAEQNLALLDAGPRQQ
jgi:tetratricopeptide (TPR) repeat protein